MHFIHSGIYHWRPRRIAFRNDYCRACRRPTLAVLVRTIDVLHLSGLPVLPLGVWSRWRCRRCGGRPHQAQVRQGFKIAGAVLLVLMILGAWTSSFDGTLEDTVVLWVYRLGLPAGLWFTVRSIIRHRPEPSFQEKLKTVIPFDGWSCPLCGGELIRSSTLVCHACGAQHRPLNEPKVSS